MNAQINESLLQWEKVLSNAKRMRCFVAFELIYTSSVTYGATFSYWRRLLVTEHLTHKSKILKINHKRGF